MNDFIISEIRLFPVSFSYPGWLKCEGQSLSISAYLPLYQAIGNRFGSNSPDTFKLPDLRGAQAFSSNMCYYMNSLGIIPTDETLEYYLGEILLLPFDNDLDYYVECKGQSYDIRTNTALYALIGNKFGGTPPYFNLPDLRKFAPAANMKYFMVTGGLYPLFQ
jgi:microcystin-dependent protein